jgi:quercetin dioxygenase-like cupin family protein
MGYTLALFEDRVPAGAFLALGPANRVLFALSGDAAVTWEHGEARLPREKAWHGGSKCVVRAGRPGLRLLRFDLLPDRSAPSRGRSPATLRLEQPMELDPAAPWLMRCDRVDFAPGGVALPHRHRGGGIRCLLRGRLEVTVGDAPPRKIVPGGAWFESGQEPVVARAAPDDETSFVRVSILPADIKGQSSIVYVDPDDATRGKPRRYTVFVDEPITL